MRPGRRYWRDRCAVPAFGSESAASVVLRVPFSLYRVSEALAKGGIADGISGARAPVLLKDVRRMISEHIAFALSLRGRDSMRPCRRVAGAGVSVSFANLLLPASARVLSDLLQCGNSGVWERGTEGTHALLKYLAVALLTQRHSGIGREVAPLRIESQICGRRASGDTARAQPHNNIDTCEVATSEAPNKRRLRHCNDSNGSGRSQTSAKWACDFVFGD
eukprot:IDg1046t1